MNDTNREWDLIAFWDVIMPIRFSLLVIRYRRLGVDRK